MIAASEQHPSPPRLDGAESASVEWRESVLASFVQGARLLKIPARRKKRQVVLDWLVGQFDAARDYREQEVNEVILRHHEDYATLRRELIGYRLMTRQGGVYRRTENA